MTCFFDFEGQIALSSYAAGLLAWKTSFLWEKRLDCARLVALFCRSGFSEHLFSSRFHQSRRIAEKQTCAPLSCVMVLFFSALTFQYLDGVVRALLSGGKGGPPSPIATRSRAAARPRSKRSSWANAPFVRRQQMPHCDLGMVEETQSPPPASTIVEDNKHPAPASGTRTTYALDTREKEPIPTTLSTTRVF